MSKLTQGSSTSDRIAAWLVSVFVVGVLVNVVSDVLKSQTLVTTISISAVLLLVINAPGGALSRGRMGGTRLAKISSGFLLVCYVGVMRWGVGYEHSLFLPAVALLLLWLAMSMHVWNALPQAGGIAHVAEGLAFMLGGTYSLSLALTAGSSAGLLARVGIALVAISTFSLGCNIILPAAKWAHLVQTGAMALALPAFWPLFPFQSLPLDGQVASLAGLAAVSLFLARGALDGVPAQWLTKMLAKGSLVCALVAVLVGCWAVHHRISAPVLRAGAGLTLVGVLVGVLWLPVGGNDRLATSRTDLWGGFVFGLVFGGGAMVCAYYAWTVQGVLSKLCLAAAAVVLTSCAVLLPMRLRQGADAWPGSSSGYVVMSWSAAVALGAASLASGCGALYLTSQPYGWLVAAPLVLFGVLFFRGFMGQRRGSRKHRAGGMNWWLIGLGLIMSLGWLREFLLEGARHSAGSGPMAAWWQLLLGLATLWQGLVVGRRSPTRMRESWRFIVDWLTTTGKS